MNFQDIGIGKVFRLAKRPAEDLIKNTNTTASFKGGGGSFRLSWRTGVIVAPYEGKPEYLAYRNDEEKKKDRIFRGKLKRLGWKSEQELLKAMRAGEVEIPKK